MKLMFVHDMVAEKYKDEYFARSYEYDNWEKRYLSCFNKIVVCFRTINSENNLNGIVDKTSGPKVEFEERFGCFKGPEIFISKRIKKIIRENLEKSDAVIVRLDSFLGLQTIYECRKMKKPYLIELVGCVWDSFWNHGIAGKILAPYLYLRTKWEVKNAPFVVYVTKEFLQKRYPTNGINTNISNVKLRKQNESDLIERISKIKNKDGKIILGTAANVNIRYKGHQFVIKALGLLKKLGYLNFEYQIVGSGDPSYLRKIAKKNNVENEVKFLGSFPHEKIFLWLKENIDIYIQPSLQEGLPRSVIEAMSLGVPCIGTDVAGIPELLDRNWIFKRRGNKPKKIVELLLKINKKLLIEQAKRNFYEASNYNHEFLLKKRKIILEKYKDLIRNTSKNKKCR